jgi:hypothetical protein
MRLLDGAKQTSKNSIRKEFDITYIDLLDIYNNQDGLCYYTGLKMAFDGAWKISIERLNQSHGYVISNIVLCCLECNPPCQWYKENIRFMFDSILNNAIQSRPFETFEKITKHKNPEKIQTKYENGVIFKRCNTCHIFKELEFMNYSMCKECRHIQCKSYANTPNGAMIVIQCSIILRTKTREQSNTSVRRDKTPSDIDLEFLHELYNSQKGLCAISGMPMYFDESHGRCWKISIERKDVYKGYLRSNVCFICLMFQASDHTLKCKTQHIIEEDPLKRNGWNPEKFNLFKQSYLQREATE